MNKKSHSKLPLIKVINIVDDKGYDVIPIKTDKGYKSYIFYNDNIFKIGTIMYYEYIECLSETYFKLYSIYCKDDNI